MSTISETPYTSTTTEKKQTSNDVEQNKVLQGNKLRSSLAQITATLGFCVMLVGIGLIFAMPTLVIGALLNSKEEFSLDENSASWFGSLMFIIQPIGSVVSGLIQDTFGRKRCMILVNVPEIIGWIVLYYSSNVFALYFVSVTLGLTLGFLEAPILSYIGEICEPRLRGPMSLLAGSTTGIGVLMGCLFGAMTDWRNVCLISVTVPTMAIVSIMLIPESPTWLLCVGRVSEAEQALCWLRGWAQPVDVREEFLALLAYTKSPNINEATDLPSTDNKIKTHNNHERKPPKSLGIIGQLSLLSKPKLYRPMTLVLVYFFVSHCISLMGMRPFLVKIFNDVGMPIGSHWVLVLTFGTQLIGAIICMFVMHKVKKRPLTFISLSFSIISCVLIGVFLMLPTNFPWTVCFFFCLSFFATGFGVCPLPWVLLSEVLPLEGRGMAGGLSAAVCYIMIFVVTKTYINLENWFNVSGTCFIYSTIGCIGFIYLYFKLPETEGKTLREIEEYFKDKDINIKDKEEISKPFLESQ